MKVRKGFVGNSSSSSFVIVGIKTKITDEDKVDSLYEMKDNGLCFFEVPYRENDEYYIGFELSNLDDDGWESKEQKLPDFKKIISKIKPKIEKLLDVQIEDEDFRLISGITEM